MPLKPFFVAIILVSLCLLSNSTNKYSTTSLFGMEELLHTEEQMTNILQDYANELENKLNVVRSFINATRNELEKAKGRAEEYLSNPLNAFSLIRRTHEDWIKWKNYLKRPIGNETLQRLKSLNSKLPKDKDLKEAFNAIERLKSVYDLNVSDLANGILNGKQYDAKLSSRDSFSIGLHYIKNSEDREATLWINESLKSYSDNEINAALAYKKQKILQAYAAILLKQNRFEDALYVVIEALNISSTNKDLLGLKKEIERHRINEKILPETVTNVTIYHIGCGGNFPINTKTKNLFCRFNTTTNAFTKLAPFKIEEISLDPYLILFHDVLSDDEIEHIIQLSRPNLIPATILKQEIEKIIVNDWRKADHINHADNETEITMRINQRIHDMTGFDLTNSEYITVINYGLGGYFKEHSDYFDASFTEKHFKKQGNRLATVLFYMSDVEQGGATIFPEIQTTIFPKKGAAILWYNLNDRGEGDNRTIHAACPTIIGSKWVMTKWIREKLQFRARPCLKE